MTDKIRFLHDDSDEPQRLDEARREHTRLQRQLSEGDGQIGPVLREQLERRRDELAQIIDPPLLDDAGNETQPQR